MSKSDPFRPTTQPAQAIYDAFAKASAVRKDRTFEQWRKDEDNAVLNAAIEQAQQLNLNAPTLEQVQEAEMMASGHSDYGAQWAYNVTDIMRGDMKVG